jgi:hypothetical protein
MNFNQNLTIIHVHKHNKEGIKMAYKFNKALFLMSFLSCMLVSCVFSDKEYSSQIAVNLSLLTQQQVSELFANKDVTQKSYNEMQNQPIYFVIQLINKGNKGAWGVLNCHVDNEFKEKIEVKILGPNLTNLIVVPYYGIINYTSNKKPVLKSYWKSLYTK